MGIIVSNIKMPLEHDLNDVYKKAIRLSGIDKNNIKEKYLCKKSVDARKGNISIVYSVCFELENINEFKASDFVSEKKTFKFELPLKKASHTERPIIVGAGPAGLFCCYLLCEYGYNPIIVERGGKTEERISDVDNFFKNKILNVNSNIQFGEGGAGTFSDGKLVTRINDERCSYVIDTFVKFGAPAEISYLAKPHLGTDNLRNIIINMRNYLISCGTEFIYNTAVEKIIVKNGEVKGVKLSDGNIINSDIVVLATGHSARDTYEMLNDLNISMIKKPFSVGVRIEHEREFIDKGRYGKFYNHPELKSAEYQFSYRKGERACYTFCMCPGGTVVAAASEENTVVTNGMSDYCRNGLNSNSAVAVSVLPDDTGDGLLSGMYFQRELERKAFKMAGSGYSAPVQLSSDFIRNEKTNRFKGVNPTYPCGYEFCNLNELFPSNINNLLSEGLLNFDSKIKGFATGDGVLTGVETRTSAPLRILRNECFMSPDAVGLYPAGEGAGYAGGITSAAVDGLRIAEAIICR